MKKLSGGFSMIEVVIVVAIIALLIVLAIWADKIQIFKAFDSTRKADLDKIKTSLEQYEQDQDCYPVMLPVCGEEVPTEFKNYFKEVPCDPQKESNYVYYPDPSSSCPKWFWLFAIFSNESDPQTARLGCSNGCGPSYLYDYYVSSSNAPIPPSGEEPERTPVPTREPTGYYGCIKGMCVPVYYNPDRPGIECDPNYNNLPDCLARCPGQECIEWKP